jgi:hypothetical protein
MWAVFGLASAGVKLVANIGTLASAGEEHCDRAIFSRPKRSSLLTRMQMPENFSINGAGRWPSGLLIRCNRLLTLYMGAHPLKTRQEPPMADPGPGHFRCQM